MKKILSGLILLAGIACSQVASAQVSVNINIGSQPIWGPTGYDYVNYYYLPDANAYYDVPRKMFVFYQGGRWVTGASLPGRNVDLYRIHKVVVNERDPWLHNDVYSRRYANFRGRNDQQSIRDSRDSRYWQNPGHPHYNEWRNSQSHNNNNRGNDNHNHRNDNHDRRGGRR